MSTTERLDRCIRFAAKVQEARPAQHRAVAEGLLRDLRVVANGRTLWQARHLASRRAAA